MRPRSARSWYAANEIVASRMSRLGFACVSVTMRSASRNGSGRNSTASTTLKTAVVAPMPMAMTAIATIEKPGALISDRAACRMGSHHVSFARHRAGHEPPGAERRDVEAWIAARNEVGQDAAGGGRMLKTVAAEPVDEEHAVDAGGGS